MLCFVGLQVESRGQMVNSLSGTWITNKDIGVADSGCTRLQLTGKSRFCCVMLISYVFGLFQ